jgi:hypothetical protein
MATSGPQANLSFLPWVRQGAAASIGTLDSLGAGQPAVADLSAVLSVNGSAAPPVTVRLRGPADVVGIDANQVVRRDPRPGSIDFEPNYFASLEFDRADFPWLFTPARADTTGKLRPWLCLVVVRKQDGITLGPAVDAPCTVLQIAAPAKPSAELPNLVDSWAWAHAQAAASDSSAAQVGNALAGAPALSLSRLLCPRILAADTDYIACVVPTFELGRKAGLGQPIADTELVAANALGPAWTATSKLPLQLPVYHHWEFRTGPGGDFESLVRRLKPQPVPDGLGRRPIDISQPGFRLPADFPRGTALGLEGALQPMNTPDTPAPWDEATAKPFQTALAGIVNAPGLSEVADPHADPLLAPPLYGRWHAARAIVARGALKWLDQLNLDPRSRTVAAFGTRVVQEHQEALMAAAWEQAADLQRANQRMRQLQLSLAVGTSLHARHFASLGAETLVRVGAPAFARIRTVAAGETAPRTLLAQMAGKALPLAATSAPMRRIGRERGPLTRRIAAQGMTRSTTLTWVTKLNLGLTFNAPPATDQATIDAVRQRLPANVVIRAYREVTKALIDGQAGRNTFQVAAEGSQVTVPNVVLRILLPDSPSAREFRLAASEHLGRINPGRASFIFSRVAMPLEQLQETVLAQTQPRQTLVALARAVVAVGPGAVPPVDTPASAAVGIDTIMAAPSFRQPMYEPLRDLSQDLLLPGLQTVPPDSVIGLKTNRRFVEAYMVGLNVEMARELLWRGFPTDQRGTCFDQFWDVRGAPAPRPDIGPLHLWRDRPLADAATAPVREQFVMLMRSALLKRYPNAVIFAVPAVLTNGVRAPNDDAAAEVQPAFSGSMQPDVSFFGFDLTTAQATGADGKAGYYIVIQEHPTEPRFGLDEDTPTGGASHLAVAGGPPAGVPLAGLQWGRNGAHMAGIVRQLPVRIAIHASQLVKR